MDGLNGVHDGERGVYLDLLDAIVGAKCAKHAQQDVHEAREDANHSEICASCAVQCANQGER
jgi:hypothetical protein